MADLKYQEILFTIPEDLSGERLDKALSSLSKINSRSRAAQLIQMNLVFLNDQTVKPSLRVQGGEAFKILIPQAQESALAPYEFELDIVYEDDDLIVINKPAGLVVHPSAGHESDTLVNALIHSNKDLSMGFNEQRPGIVHRLDKETSGLLVVAKNDFTHQNLAGQFKKKSVKRIYWALVYGPLRQESGTKTSYLKRHPKDRKRFASERLTEDREPSGKLATTHYKLKKNYISGVSLIECQLETGRTHQIRVHMTELGHPIIGDTLYGSNNRLKNFKSVKLRKAIQTLNRIGLHAAVLGFIHPRTKKELNFSASWPDDLKEVLKVLGEEAVS